PGGERLANFGFRSLKGVRCFSGIVGNGFRFHTRDIEMKRVHQNSGVMVKGIVGDTEKNYNEILTDILEIQYLDGKRVMLFQCDWWDVHRIGRGVKVDKHGYVSVNSLCSLRTKEPFVLMSQAKQVFYVSDGLDPNWLGVVETHPRHHYNVAEGKLLKMVRMHYNSVNQGSSKMLLSHKQIYK
ncbi:Methionine--tRNA ligase, partial [Bienertia sinuspersici]